MIDQGEKVFVYHTQEGEFGFNYRATIALREKEGGYQVGLSICSPYDRFVKKRGVQGAVGRSRSEHDSIFIPSTDREEILGVVKSKIDAVISKKEMLRKLVWMHEVQFQHMKEVAYRKEDVKHARESLKADKEQLRNIEVLGDVELAIQSFFEEKEAVQGQ